MGFYPGGVLSGWGFIRFFIRTPLFTVKHRMFGPELNQTFCDLSELFQSCLLALMGHDSRPQMQAAGCPKKVVRTLENCKHQRHLIICFIAGGSKPVYLLFLWHPVS